MPPSVPQFEPVRVAVDALLDDLLVREQQRWRAVHGDLDVGFDLLRRFIANGGKRLRPAFCFWAFVGAGGDPADPRIAELGAAVEMLHTFALVHDDVMDGSDTRRHAPTVHRAVEALHADARWSGEARRFSEGMAILLGDLAFVYADRLVAGFPRPVTDLFGEMQIELHVGQYLDMMGAARRDLDRERAETVIRYKTAKYSVERPLHLGAALAGGLDDVGPGLSRFGLAVGEAFQLRDDVLGAFGDPAETGKPAGDDFREGKQTLLVHLARTWSDATGHADAEDLLGRLGEPDLAADEVQGLRDLIEASGARAAVEVRIDELVAAGLAALAECDLRAVARDELAELARRSAWRST